MINVQEKAAESPEAAKKFKEENMPSELKAFDADLGGHFSTDKKVNEILQKSEMCMDQHSFAALKAVKLRAQQFKVEERDQKECKATEEVKQWIDKLKGAQKSVQNEVLDLAKELEKVEQCVKDIENGIVQKRQALNEAINSESPDDDETSHHFLLNEITKLKNEKKLQMQGILPSLKEKKKEKEKELGETENKIAELEAKLMSSDS